MRSGAAYTEQLHQLLPTGAAWTRAPGAWLGKMLQAIADEFARVDGRGEALLEEADPLTTLELLPDWERVAGLPDACVPISETIRERQIAVARKIAGIGGQTRAFYIDLAARLGIEVSIEEFNPFVAGSHAGDELFDDSWRFVWRVTALPASASSNSPTLLRFSDFRAGESSAGDRLRNVSADALECIIRRAAPAHTTVLFAYPTDPEPTLWFDFTNE